MSHSKSDEVLSHFQCADCQKWWSIGDFNKHKVEYLYCPWCGKKDQVARDISSQNSNNTQTYPHRTTLYL